MRSPSSHPRGHALATAALLASVAFAVLILGAPHVAAVTYWSSDITTNVTWGPTGVPADATYVVLQNLTVHSSGSLTIQPGTTVLFARAAHLYIEGRFLADGTSSTPIAFGANGTAPTIYWGGIRFNATSQGSITWSSFSNVDGAVGAVSSSPALANDTVNQSTYGFQFTNAASVSIADSRIDGALAGIVLVNSAGQVVRNTINGTAGAIGATKLGSLTIANNTLTNVTSAPGTASTAVGVLVNDLTSVVVQGNTIRNLTGGPATGSGRDGATAMGIVVNGTGVATISRNIVSDVVGGAGGAGTSSTLAAGGSGGSGGAAFGIVVGNSPSVSLEANSVSNLTGGAGGKGGGSTVTTGGAGGPGGAVAGIQVYNVTSPSPWTGQILRSFAAGRGGDGGSGTTGAGSGGPGGDAYGVLFGQVVGGQLATTSIQGLSGGTGGNSTLGPAGAYGGPGGSSSGVAVLGADGTTSLHANAIASVVGGSGGAGRLGGGPGGNATGLLAFGDGTPFNDTGVSFNQVNLVVGGPGGPGVNAGGAGGQAVGLLYLHVTPTSANNSASSVFGGPGGNATTTTPAGSGGQAAGILGVEILSGLSRSDRVQGIRNGTAGIGTAPPPAYGTGIYVLGNQTITAALTVENGTVAGTSTYDLYIDNYTEVTTINTPFGWGKVQVEPAGNLTVRNYLSLRILWPDNTTPVNGARALVTDNAATVWNATVVSGVQDWVLVTDRVYRDSNTPIENVTTVTISYPPYAFAADPRAVNMSSSQTETFTMNDTTAPTSAAYGLPAYEATRTFSVPYTASDGNGTGLRNVTLWFRASGGNWTESNASAAAATGSLPFVASSDGIFEFVTIATDLAGNVQPFPSGNDTWTVVDTTPPTSRVYRLPTYETSLDFPVSWGPRYGTSDIKNYTIQFDAGSGWVTWLANTTSSSGTFTAAGSGVYSFRSLARDFAGNVEVKSYEDTHTTVDVVAPTVLSISPSGNVTANVTAIVVAFSEPMNKTSAAAAFMIFPFVNGSLTWNNDSTVLTFSPTQPLAAGTTYTVTVGTGATDVAGNPLVRAAVGSLTIPAPPPPPVSLGSLWPLLLLAAAVLAALALILVCRRRGSVEAASETAPPPPPAQPPTEIDDVFLLYNDGILIKHETLRLRPDIDTDILTGMLAVVQQFVKDSFQGEAEGDLDEIKLGEMHIYIGRGKWLILATRASGGALPTLSDQMKACIEDMETHHWDQLEDWNGDMAIAKVLGPYLKKLIRGEYG